MTASNFPRFLSLVWPADGDFDSPKQGYHVTPGDLGGGTFGGITEATWAGAKARGWAAGTLRTATEAQLADVLQAVCWGPVCNNLASGLDILVANGRMMSGEYPQLFQQALGFVGYDVDGEIGPDTIGTAHSRDPVTLINALHGVHYAYLCRLPGWSEFGAGWARRLVAAHSIALAAVGD